MTQSSSLTIHIRLTSAAKFTLCGMFPSSTILQVKQRIANEEASGNVPVERQRLIYKGRILSDDSRSLSDYGIVEDNQTLHLVKGAAAAAAQPPTPAAGIAAPSTAPVTAPVSASVSAPPAGPNWMQQMIQMQQQQQQQPNFAQMQQQLMNNPELLNSMMNSPAVQSIMSNPDFMSNMMENNPQMRQVLDSNPELRNILRDPEYMRRSMELMRDPQAMNHMMRNQDLAMSQIENMPGGFNALRRMYEDVQEPFMNAMSGPSTNTASSQGSSSNTQSVASQSNHGASGAAMPNPWGAPPPPPPPPPTRMNPSSSPNSAPTYPSSMMNPWSHMMTSGGAAPPNLEQALSMMENPIFSQMMNQVMANPSTFASLMESNPMLRQLRETNPEAAALMSNPETMRTMMNPDMIRAMMQMQGAMQPWNPSPTMPISGSNPLDFSSLMQPASSTTTNTTSPMWMSSSSSSPSIMIPPEQRFQSQLQSLNDMGFEDNVLNVRVLVQTHGNVNRAVELLLSGEVGSSSSSLPPSSS